MNVLAREGVRFTMNHITNPRFHSIVDREMKWPAIATFLIAHAVATGTYLAVFLVVPAALAVVAVILLLIGGLITGDMGGPLFLPGVFIMGLVYALCAAALGAVLFLVTGGIQLLRRRVSFSAWIPVALSFPVVFTLLVLTRSGGVFLSLAVTAAFLTYWLAFSGSDAILRWIRGRWKHRKNQG